MKSLHELMSLKGRVALVAGGAGHIGKVFIEALAELGADIVLLDAAEVACMDTAKSISQQFMVKTVPLVVDLSHEHDVRSVPKKVFDAFGRIDVVINAAALVGTTPLEGWTTPFLEQSSATWRKALEVNLTSAFVLIQSCTPLLKLSGHGSIINVGSTYGVVGPDWRLYEGTSMGNPAAYAASKGGLLQFTRWLSTVLAPDIRVNMISPGGVSRHQPASFQERYISRTPLKRMATEEDFKGAVAYLASDLSQYVTGQNLMVDGGWTAW